MGSQPLLGSVPYLEGVFMMSAAADIYPFEAPALVSTATGDAYID